MEKLKATLKWVQEAATNIGRFIVGLLLLFVGLFLLPLVTAAAVGFYFATIGARKQNVGEILVSNGTMSKNIALGIDLLGNIIGGEFFNYLLLTEPSPFPFGIPGEKISTVLELNFKIQVLSEWGINLRRDLNIIEKNHCRKSLISDLLNAKYTLDRHKAIEDKTAIIKATQNLLSNYN